MPCVAGSTNRLLGVSFWSPPGRRRIVNDDPDFLRAGGHAHVEVHAIAVSPRHLDGAAAIVAGVFRRVIEGVDRPAAVVAVRPKVVDAISPAGMGGSAACAVMHGSVPSRRNANMAPNTRCARGGWILMGRLSQNCVRIFELVSRRREDIPPLASLATSFVFD